MARVFRMKFVPTISTPGISNGEPGYNTCRNEIFDKFIKHGFVGTGWGYLGLRAGMVDNEIRPLIKAGEQLNTLRLLCQIDKDDLIWVLHNGSYYLFKVSKNLLGNQKSMKEYYDIKDWYSERDISSIYTGEWCCIGDVINVPGVIVNAMGIGPTMMEIKTAPELTMNIWNYRHPNETPYTMRKITDELFWHMLTDRQKEGLALTYIQKTYDCIVNTESLKHNTAVYECELIGENGTRFLPQVKSGKSGDKEYPVEEYCKIVKGMFDEYLVKPVLFYENEDYGTYEDEELIKITKNDLMNFIREYPYLISKKVMEVYELIED